MKRNYFQRIEIIVSWKSLKICRIVCFFVSLFKKNLQEEEEKETSSKNMQFFFLVKWKRREREKSKTRGKKRGDIYRTESFADRERRFSRIKWTFSTLEKNTATIPGVLCDLYGRFSSKLSSGNPSDRKILRRMSQQNCNRR